ncbi:hypothetical protein [Streptomyces sp. NPDC054901]
MVYDDALRAREAARAEGAPFPRTGDLSKLLITRAKRTEGLPTGTSSTDSRAGALAWARPGSRAVRTIGRPSGSPRTPGGGSRPAPPRRSARSAA